MGARTDRRCLLLRFSFDRSLLLFPVVFVPFGRCDCLIEFSFSPYLLTLHSGDGPDEVVYRFS